MDPYDYNYSALHIDKNMNGENQNKKFIERKMKRKENLLE